MGIFYETELEREMALFHPIAAEVADREYQKYLRTGPVYDEDDDMSYQQWLNCKSEWERLNSEYMAEIEPLDYTKMTSAQEQRQRELLKAMSDIEFYLRY